MDLSFFNNIPLQHRLAFFSDAATYHPSFTTEFDIITPANVQLILLQAIWEFELLAGNEAYSGYYFVDWRINFQALQEYVQQHIHELPHKQVNLCMAMHDKASAILYRRLGIE